MALNRMNNLLTKIERRLGTQPLMLPDNLNKDAWVEIITEDSLPTFSRYFPHMVTIKIDLMDKSRQDRDGFYLIDSSELGGAEILGIRDINYAQYGREGGLGSQNMGSFYDYLSTVNSFSTSDMMLLQARADITSMFNNNLFLTFKHPNRIKLESVTGTAVTGGLTHVPVDIYVVHPTNLSTISPTKMNLFENLCTADVATTLVGYLSHFDNLENQFGSVDLKLGNIEQWASRREDYINEMKEGYVSASNDFGTLIYCV